MTTFVIAEVGVNHNGCLNEALRLIDAARFAGADCVKFQAYNSARLATGGARPAAYQEKFAKDLSQKEMLARFELNLDDFQVLAEYASDQGLEFLLSVFEESLVPAILEMNLVGRWKIASGELTNLPLLVACAETQLPVILSTGMATIDEVDAAVEVLLRTYARHLHSTTSIAQTSAEPTRAHDLQSNLLTLLHCTSEYPAPEERTNLRAITTLKQRYGLPVGYSDHTSGTLVAPLAVALGASLIEKHITLDRFGEGPDHEASLEPHDFREMVSLIRRAEGSMGDGVKQPTVVEMETRALVRKSIFANQEIHEGEIFTEHSLRTSRPGHGLGPELLHHLYGRRARRSYIPGDLIEMIEIEEIP